MAKILVVIVVLVAAFLAYGWMTKERPLEERLDSAMQELGDGNLGNAVDEVNNRTPLDQARDAIEDAGERVSETINN